MRILKFNESEKIDISSDRIDEINLNLENLSNVYNNDIKTIERYLIELNSYKSKSIKSNDQIDDSISEFQILSNNLLESVNNINKIIDNLKDYKEGGRKILYKI